jgi:uncharacterized membrane protein YkvA (DUF1232 family)
MLKNVRKVYKIYKSFDESKVDAESMLNNKKVTKEKLDEALNKLNSVKKGPIENFFYDLKLMILLMKDWISGRYKDIPYNSIIIIFGAVLYFLSPVDLISDFFIGTGFLDDAFLIGLVLKQIRKDLFKYKLWKYINE